MHVRIRIFVLLCIVFSLSLIPAQEKKPARESRSQPSFKLPVNVIVVYAGVNDKKGNPVTDLVQNDFKIYEDGKLQTIQTFALESYESPASKEKAQAKGARAAETEAANAGRPRMISLVIDDVTMASFEYYPAIVKAITRFVERDMGPSDRVAILSSSGRVQFPFSDNKQVLLEEINGILHSLDIISTYKSECPELTDLQAKRIAESRGGQGPPQLCDPPGEIQDPDLLTAVVETIPCANLEPKDNPCAVWSQARAIALNAARTQYQESEYRSRTLLNTLRRHIRSLRHFDAVKNVILFSDGFLADGGSYISFELQDVVDQALASGVVLNTVDARGLFTLMVPPSKIQPSKIMDPHKQEMDVEDQLAQDGPLSRMANDTGGLFYHNNNDLYEGVRNVVHRHSSYYVLSYNAPQQKSDGSYHHIKVEIARSGLELSYRRGYYAPREELTFERRKKEDILEALQMPDNLNEIPLGLAYNYYQEDDARYVLSLSTNVDIHRIHFLDEDSRRKNLVNLVVVALDETDHYVDGVEKSIDFKLTDSSYAGLLNHGINSRVTFHLPLGRYKIKAVVREGSEGKMGSVTRAIEIP